ncbi:aconitase family protein [Salmonella enterica subsp. enterica serovar Montevideo]
MTSLPVAAVLPELLTALKTAPQVLLSAPTGAGKSTWLPLQLLQQGPVAGKILLLEPRRLAARNVAQRLAEALNEKPGETVGYRMRAQSCVGPRTRLEVVTEGVLTRMIQRDPELRGVGLVILDEFHERSLQADLALALLLDIQQGLRDDLRLLIMSATLDNHKGQLPTRLWVAPPTRMDAAQLTEEGYYSVFGKSGARIEIPGCSLCMGNQARVADGATVVSTSTRNFPNRLGTGANVFLASAELAAVAALIGKLPTPEEYQTFVAQVDKTAVDTYRYLNFDQLSQYTEKADGVIFQTAV